MGRGSSRLLTLAIIRMLRFGTCNGFGFPAECVHPMDTTTKNLSDRAREAWAAAEAEMQAERAAKASAANQRALKAAGEAVMSLLGYEGPMPMHVAVAKERVGYIEAFDITVEDLTFRHWPQSNSVSLMLPCPACGKPVQCGWSLRNLADVGAHLTHPQECDDCLGGARRIESEDAHDGEPAPDVGQLAWAVVESIRAWARAGFPATREDEEEPF